MSFAISSFALKRIGGLGLARHTFLSYTPRMLSTVAPAEVDTFLKKHDQVLTVDSSWYMPNEPRNAFNSFQLERFGKNAIFFDIDSISDKSSPFPHMLPSKEQFAKEVGELGISNSSRLLFYDQQGVFSLCRAAWMFEIFGHNMDNLFLLNTFPSYKQSFSDPNLVMVVHEMSHNDKIQKDVVTEKSPLEPATYTASFDASKVVSYEQLVDLVKSGKIGKDVTLIDARSHDRFTAAVNEPRKGLKSGHVPGAVNIPYASLLTPYKSFASSMTLEHVIGEKAIPKDKPVIVMCGTGVTACVVRAALIFVGYDPAKIAVYDGSWTEWGQRAPEELVVKGE